MGYWHAHPKSHPNKWGALTAIGFILFAIAVSATGIMDVLTDMGNDLHMGVSEQTWVVNTYLLVVAAVVVAGGQFGDVFGRRLMFAVGVTTFMAGSIVIATADVSTTVIIGRALQGLGAAAVMPATLSIIDVAFPPEQRSTAMGVWGGIVGIGFALGVLIGGFLTHIGSWHWLFWFNVPLCLAALAMTFWAISESRDESRSRVVDVAGLVIMAAAMFSVVLGLDQGESWGWGSMAVIGLLVGSAALFATFVFVESRLKNPMVHLDLFRSRAFIAGNVGTFFITWALISVILFVASYLQNFLLLDYSALKAGVAIMPMGFAMFTLSMFSGRVIRWIGAPLALTLGMLVVAVGFYLLSLVSLDSDYSDFWIPMILVGAGFGMTFGPFSAIAVASAEASRVGEASGIVNMSRYLGGALGIVICTALYDTAALDKLNEVIGRLGLNFSAREKLDQLATGNDSVVRAEIDKLGSAKQTFIDGAGQAITDGFVVAMLTAAIVCTVGAAICFALLSKKYPTEIPPAEVRDKEALEEA